MQSLRRTLSKRERSRSKDRSPVDETEKPASAVLTSPPRPLAEKRSQSLGLIRKTTLPTPPLDKGSFIALPPCTLLSVKLTLVINVIAANSLLRDRDIAVLTSPPSNITPTHVITPATPTTASAHPDRERERAFSEPPPPKGTNTP